jgi:hypothetical protein
VELGLVGVDAFEPMVLRFLEEDQEKDNKDYGHEEPHRK